MVLKAPEAGHKTGIQRIKSLNWVVLALFSLGSLLLGDMRFSVGVMAGGLLAIANFGALGHTIERAFSPDGIFRAKKKTVVAKYYLRMAAMGLAVYLLITRQVVHPIALAIGLSVIVVSISVFGVKSALKKSGEAV